MDNRVLNLTYASSLTDLCEINSSFDSGILRIAYTGENRNGSYISKETFERCMKTIYNCPIVCNYDRDTDTLGGHDVEVVVKDDEFRLVNLTDPIGCVPESSRIFWEEVTEDDGTIHEYLCAEALLWKRQEAYKKIKEDGVTAQSMEITVKEGKTIDGIYHINNFEFTAFALLGIEPCFESASLETFSKRDFKKQLAEMMLELKESFNLVKPSGEDDNKLLNHSMEGGEQVLDKNELVVKYGIDVETLEFSLEDFTYEELEEKFKAMTEEPEVETPVDNENKFALMSNIVEEMRASLDAVKVQREWGECNRYWFVDCDMELGEIYCWDTNDWLLYGFTYEMNGDNVVIDFESKKRKKYIIADFDEGEQESPFASVFAQLEQRIHDNAEWEAKYQTASDTIASMEPELERLREFKADIETANAERERNNVFAQFEDLVGVEAFEALKENCAEYSIETLEEKCYAIRGRQGVSAKFSAEPKTPKIIVEPEVIDNEPYGGVFKKYGFTAE